MELNLQYRPLSELAGKYNYFQSKNDSNPWSSKIEILLRKEWDPTDSLPNSLIRDRGSLRGEFREINSSLRSSSGNKIFWEIGDPILSCLKLTEFPGTTISNYAYKLGIQGDEGIFIESSDFSLLHKADFDFEGVFCLISDFREVSYAYEGDGILLYMDGSKFKYSYNTLRLFVGSSIDELTQVPFSDFVRYRDGGTTYFCFNYKGKEYEAFFPSKLTHTAKPSINGNSCVEISQSMLNSIQTNLKVLIYPNASN